MTDYEKLESLIAEIDRLVDHSVTHTTPAFQSWHASVERFLIKKFGEGSFEHMKFRETRFYPSISTPGTDFSKKCKEGLIASKMIFTSYLDEMKEINVTIPQNNKPKHMNKIFVVHGHDGELKQSVARIVEKQGIEAIILSEKVNLGRTIIEKFEDYSDVDGAICLFTADDLGHAKPEKNLKYRARQNVVLETGYFMGKLGRNHVVILADKDIEMPSDLSGIVYTSTSNWQVDLLKELDAMGYTVDFNKLFK